jgi:hypothetical protein
MPKSKPKRDPIAAQQRQVAAARRVGLDRQCASGEGRPEALIANREPTLCSACERESKGKTTMDNHHVAGKANSPITISVPVNDHRAELSVGQHDWPKETRENPDGSPLLAAAGCVRGFMDTVIYLVNQLLLWIPELLERLDAFLGEALGPKWWLDTPLEGLVPKR